jgi:pyrroline-5-carboxylate reductase
MLPNPTWLVGCGNMAGSMVQGWKLAGADFSGTTIIRPSGQPFAGIPAVTRFIDAGSLPRLVVLGFKPQQLGEVAQQLSGFVTPRTTIVSILAGVEAATLRKLFPNAGMIVRADPNLPVAVRRGVTALFTEGSNEQSREQVSQLFSALGYAMWTTAERSLEAIGSISGPGPAYVARFIDALAKAGIERGLPEATAKTVALETVLGTAWMAATNQESMESVARRVASPNGTTEQGLKVLDGDQGLAGLLSQALAAAERRGAELAEEARGLKLAQDARSA